MKTINKKLTTKRTQQFLKFLKDKYIQDKDIVIKFQENSCGYFQLQDQQIPVLYGLCQENYITVSLFQRTEDQILHTLAHECKHALLFLQGGCKQGDIIHLNTGDIRLCWEEEDECNNFADQVVREFLMEQEIRS